MVFNYLGAKIGKKAESTKKRAKDLAVSLKSRNFAA
jgi:hypothetical protein